jgi:Kef-type K+ transport system membrane component KefB
MLGPSVLGNIPHWNDILFANTQYLSVIANIGLIFNMFLIGMEVDLEDMAKNFKRSAMISFSGMGLPMVLGIGTSKVLYDSLQDDKNVKFTHFALFIGVAMSITVR